VSVTFAGIGWVQGGLEIGRVAGLGTPVPLLEREFHSVCQEYSYWFLVG